MRGLISILLVILVSCQSVEEVEPPVYTNLEIIETALKYPEVRSFMEGRAYLVRSHRENDIFKNVQGTIAGFNIVSIEYAFVRNLDFIGITKFERSDVSVNITIWAGGKFQIILG